MGVSSLLTSCMLCCALTRSQLYSTFLPRFALFVVCSSAILGVWLLGTRICMEGGGKKKSSTVATLVSARDESILLQGWHGYKTVEAETKRDRKNEKHRREITISAGKHS